MTDRIKRYIKRHYKPGMILFHPAVREHFALDVSQISAILNDLECDGTLDHYFEVVCPSCHHTVSTKYKSLCDLPESGLFVCKKCGENLNAEWDLRSVHIVR